MAWTCIMFVGLEIDRANMGQAVSDNLLGDLGMTTNGTQMTVSYTRALTRVLTWASPGCRL